MTKAKKAEVLAFKLPSDSREIYAAEIVLEGDETVTKIFYSLSGLSEYLREEYNLLPSQIDRQPEYKASADEKLPKPRHLTRQENSALDSLLLGPRPKALEKVIRDSTYNVLRWPRNTMISSSYRRSTA